MYGSQDIYSVNFPGLPGASRETKQSRRDLGVGCWLLADEHVIWRDLDDRLCAGGSIHPRAALAVRQQGAEVGLW